MTEYIKVEDSFVEALLEQAAWDTARVDVSEKKDNKDSKKESKKPNPNFKPKKGAKVTQGANVDDDGEPIPVQDRDPEDKMPSANEATEEHSCPLCESTLEEALTDEQIHEHIAQIRDALQSIEEEDEDLDEVNVKGPEQFGGGVVDDDDPARKKAMARAKALALQGKKDATSGDKEKEAS